MGHPRFRKARNFKYTKRTSGDITKSSVTNWSDFLTDSDLTLAAEVGDVLAYELNGLADGTNVTLLLDVVTRVSGAAVNSFGGGGAGSGNTGDGVTAWLLASDTDRGLSGTAWYTVQAADIAAGGLVTCRLRCRTGSGSRVVASSATDPFFMFMENIGPASPH